MLIDEVEVVIKGGHGGPGKVSFFPSERAGPDGGNGGRGGDVFVTVVSDLTALNQFSKNKIAAAGNGQPGGSFLKSGLGGRDLEILLPVGTSMVDLNSGKVTDLNNIGERVLISKGGLGGRGNYELRSPRNTTPEKAQPGLPGEERHFKLILKLIADFGLIGLPNAGKSSLLNELTKANVKVAEYPFTTLEPNLGVIDKKIIADIPGLIAGASAGKGLGIKFLKHIEKVGALLHCIASDSGDVISDYQTVMEELKAYNPEVAEKPQVILLTKTDLVDKDVVKDKTSLLKRFKKKTYPVSIHDWESLETLKKALIVS